MLTFKDFQKISESRDDTICNALNNWSLADWATALSGECGEFCN